MTPAHTRNEVIQKEPIGSVLSNFSRGSGKNTSTVKTVPLYTYEPQQKSLLITKITQTVYFAPPRQTAPSIFVIGQSSNTLKKKTNSFDIRQASATPSSTGDYQNILDSYNHG